MIWQETPYTVPLAVVAVALVVSALYVWWHRRVPWAKTGALLELAGAVWILGYVLELASVPLEAKIFWAKVQYVGIVIVPVGSLAFVLQYTGHRKWLKPAVLISSTISLVTLLLVITNEVHGLIWSNIWNREVPGTLGGYADSDKTFGAGYWVFVAQSLVIVLVTIFLLVQMLVRSIHLYRWQSAALLFAVFIFVLGASVEAFYDSPPDLIVLGFAVACLIVAWCLARLRRGDVRSVSYTAIFQSMNDGVVVLDDHNTVIDLNPTALRLIGLGAPEVLGQPAEYVWPDLIIPADDGTEEMTLDRDGKQWVYSERFLCLGLAWAVGKSSGYPARYHRARAGRARDLPSPDQNPGAARGDAGCCFHFGVRSGAGANHKSTVGDAGDRVHRLCQTI